MTGDGLTPASRRLICNSELGPMARRLGQLPSREHGLGLPDAVPRLCRAASDRARLDGRLGRWRIPAPLRHARRAGWGEGSAARRRDRRGRGSHVELGDERCGSRRAGDRNPMPARRVKVRRRERPWADAPQIRRLIAVVRLRDPDLEVAVRLGALYGLRRGEVAGLTWHDVRPDSVRVHTSRVISNGRAIDSAPKTPDSAATILLDPSTVAALDAHRRRRAELAEMVPGVGEHVYVSAFGQPLYPDTLSERFARCVRASNSWPVTLMRRWRRASRSTASAIRSPRT